MQKSFTTRFISNKEFAAKKKARKVQAASRRKNR